MLKHMLKLLLRARYQRRDMQNACFPAQEVQSCPRPVLCQQGEVSWRRSSVQAVRRQLPPLSLQPRNADAKTGRRLRDCVKQEKGIWRTTTAKAKASIAPSLKIMTAETMATEYRMLRASAGKATTLTIHFKCPACRVFGLYRP
jgi:hypothetical protein